MTKDSTATEETAPAAAEKTAEIGGLTLDEIIKADRKKKRGNKKGRGRGKGKGRGRGRGRGKKKGRGKGKRGRGGYGQQGRGFYTSGFQRQMYGMMPPMAYGVPPAPPQQPLQLMYKLVQKHGLNPTIAVLQVSKQGGRQSVQVQVDLDVSALENKPAGSFGLRQLAWGTNKQDAKRKAVSQMLTHPSLQSLVAAILPKSSANTQSLFPGMSQMNFANKQNKRKKKNKKKNNKNKTNENKKKNNPEYDYCWDYVKTGEYKEDSKWKQEIPPSLWKKKADRAIELFEAYMTRRGKVMSFEFSPDPEDEDKFTCVCVVDGNNEGEGKGTRFQAKTAACQPTYEKYIVEQREELAAAAAAKAEEEKGKETEAATEEGEGETTTEN